MQALFYCLFARLLYSSTTSFHSQSRPKDAHGLYWHWIASFLVVFKQQFMQVSWLCSSNSSCNNSCNIHATIHATINETINETISDTMHTWKLEIKSAKYLPHHRCTEQFGFSRKHWLEGHGGFQSCNEPTPAHSRLRPPCFRDPSSLDWQTENISDAMFSKWRHVSTNIMQCFSKTQLFQTRILFIWSFLKLGLKKMMSKLFSTASWCRAGWHLRRTRLMKNCQGTMWLLNKSSSSIHIAVRVLYLLGAHHQGFQPFG